MKVIFNLMPSKTSCCANCLELCLRHIVNQQHDDDPEYDYDLSSDVLEMNISNKYTPVRCNLYICMWQLVPCVHHCVIKDRIFALDCSQWNFTMGQDRRNGLFFVLRHLSFAQGTVCWFQLSCVTNLHYFLTKRTRLQTISDINYCPG